MIELFKQIEWNNALLIVIGGAFLLGIGLMAIIGSMKQTRLRAEHDYLQDAYHQLQSTNQNLTQELKKSDLQAHTSEKNLARAIANIQAAKEYLEDLRNRLQKQEQLLLTKEQEIRALFEKNQQLELNATKIHTYIEEREAFFDSQIVQL